MLRNAVAVALLVVCVFGIAAQEQKETDFKVETQRGDHGYKHDGPYYHYSHDYPKDSDRKHLDYKLTLKNGTYIQPNPPVVGSNVVFTFDLYKDGEKVGRGVLTGVEVSRKAVAGGNEVVGISALVDIQDLKTPNPNSIIAAGLLEYNTGHGDSSITEGNEDLVVVGGSGRFAGAQGRLYINFDPERNGGDFVDFRLTLPAHQDY